MLRPYDVTEAKKRWILTSSQQIRFPAKILLYLAKNIHVTSCPQQNLNSKVLQVMQNSTFSKRIVHGGFAPWIRNISWKGERLRKRVKLWKGWWVNPFFYSEGDWEKGKTLSAQLFSGTQNRSKERDCHTQRVNKRKYIFCCKICNRHKLAKRLKTWSRKCRVWRLESLIQSFVG